MLVDLSDAAPETGGSAAGDVLVGIENVDGSIHNDLLIGDANANALSGSDGNDTMRPGAGADAVFGGNGVDTVDYSTSSAGVGVALASTPTAFTQGQGGDAAGDFIEGTIENVVGSASSDQLQGNGGANGLSGGGGNDVLLGLGGNDLLLGNDRNDTLVGGANGTPGAGGITDQLVGGAGIDTADYSSSTTGVTLLAGTAGTQPAFLGTTTLVNGVATSTDATGDLLTEIENIVGSSLNDSIAGNALDNSIRGGAGADTLSGGAGIDTVDYSTSSAGVAVGLSATGATLNSGGHAQGDILSSFENIIGSSFADSLTGSAAANTIRTGSTNAGGEVVRGGGGADLLIADGTTPTGLAGARALIGEGTSDVGGLDTYRSLAGFNILPQWQTGERIELDEEAVSVGRVNTSTTAYLRLDTDAVVGNGGTTTETWVAVGPSTMTATDYATAQPP